LTNYVAGYGKIILNETKQNLKEMSNKNTKTKYQPDSNEQENRKLREENEKLIQENSRLLEENITMKKQYITLKNENKLRIEISKEELEKQKNKTHVTIETVFISLSLMI
jgi:ABC-type multidrug transport system ATPase subunit